MLFFFDFFFLTTKNILVTFQCFFFLAPGHREPKSSKTFLVTFYCSFFRFFFCTKKNFGHFLLFFFSIFFFAPKKILVTFYCSFFRKFLLGRPPKISFSKVFQTCRKCFFYFFPAYPMSLKA